MTQDPLCTYAHVWLIKEAIEQAKSADPKAIRDALARIDLTAGPAATSLAPGRIRFDERGRRIGAVPPRAARLSRRVIRRRDRVY